MNKNKVRFVVVATVLVAMTLCGTVLAYMFKKTEQYNNQFTPAEVSCEVLEAFDGVQKTSIRVKNTGNIDAYLRVRLVSYWVDSEGNVVAKPSSMPAFTLADGWISGSDNTYYYQSPVSSLAPNNMTAELLSTPIFLEQDANGYLQVVEVFAEAMQSEPKQAVQNSWGVTVAANGTITAAP